MLESLLRETDWLDALRRTDEPVLLYGMGSGADKILALLSGAGIRVAGVFASDGFVRGHSYRGMRVLTRREAEERFGSFTALLAFGLEGGPDEALRAVASRHRLLAPNLPVYGAGRLDKAYIRQNAARILYVYERLADDYSKRLFYELLRYDVNGDPRALLAMESRCDPPPSYFAHGRAHIDVGAHDGATLRDYQAVSPAHGPLLAVEPDRIAFRRLCEAVSDLPLARPIRAAASDREGQACFAGGQGRGSALAERVESVRTVTVDGLCGRSRLGQPDVLRVGSLRIDAAFRPHRKRQHRFGAQLARMNHGNIQIFDIPYDLRIVALRKLRHIDRFLKWDLPAHRLQPARLPAVQHPEHKLSPDQHLFPLNP